MKMKNNELAVPILIVTPPDINIKPKEKAEVSSDNSIRSNNKSQNPKKCPQVLLEKFERMLDEGKWHAAIIHKTYYTNMQIGIR